MLITRQDRLFGSVRNLFHQGEFLHTGLTWLRLFLHSHIWNTQRVLHYWRAIDMLKVMDIDRSCLVSSFSTEPINSFTFKLGNQFSIVAVFPLFTLDGKEELIHAAVLIMLIIIRERQRGCVPQPKLLMFLRSGEINSSETLTQNRHSSTSVSWAW